MRGQVQGVGFRPFVWKLAQRFGLRGLVRNDAEGVLIRIAGEEAEPLIVALKETPPPLARIDAIEVSDIRWDKAPQGFAIVSSDGAGAETRVTPDAATCADCAAEIRDPGNRRYGYAFTNCTHCGPRFTILRSLPYDRAQTTMASFGMCAACRAEYEDPADRRFHAQPVACADCGPRVWIEPEAPSPIAAAADRLRAGQVLAIKGLGGFHLAVDAAQEAAVARLRERKHRPAKPFALMGTLDMIRRHARINSAETARLMDPAAPIVLLDCAGDPLPEGVAPGQTSLGWMLPYTPLHHLLMEAIDRPLVMTSGNLSGEPQVIGNGEARDKLGRFADAFLMHDRDIARRLDDSVERVTPHGPMILRRARGRVPGTLPLPPGFEGTPQIVAYGGQMKAAICLVKNGQALLGHHLGELDEALTWDAFLQADRDYADLFDHQPTRVACDLHPGYRASQHAHARGLPVDEVQHHHAHLAACLGENGWPLEGGPVAGIILDGTGLGTDGTLWGGEVLLGDYRDFTRIAHLTPAPLPGGDAAARDPWRNLLVRLDAAGLGGLADTLLRDHPVELLRQAVAAGVNAPLSSSVGRLFDAMAAACGLLDGPQTYEGEAAMALEAAAIRSGAGAGAGSGDQVLPYPFADTPGGLDPAPLFRAWAEDHGKRTDPGIMAARFHAGLAATFASSARRLVDTGQARAVVLSGGCFQNSTLLELTLRALGDVPVFIHRSTPANDGGLALGQALIAAARQNSAPERP